MSGIIGYENLMEAGVVIASSENAGFPVENLYDWRTSDFFKPSASGIINIDVTLPDEAAADYIAFHGHDLHKHGGSIKLQYWDGAAYADCFGAISPSDSTPRLIPFTAQTSDKWRIVIACSSVFSMAVVSFGARLTVERGLYIGWTPPKFGRDTKVVDSISDGGQFLGRSVISRGVKSTLEINRASEGWMDSHYESFISHAERKPFFLLPRPDEKPDDAVFAWTDGAIPEAAPTHYGFFTNSIPIRGLLE